MHYDQPAMGASEATNGTVREAFHQGVALQAQGILHPAHYGPIRAKRSFLHISAALRAFHHFFGQSSTFLLKQQCLWKVNG
jgi:hypothetical protein